MDPRWIAVAAPALPLAVASSVYPFALRLATRYAAPPRRPPVADPAEWPLVSVVLAAYNGERVIGRTLEQLLQADYPADRLHVLVVSDGSTDGTDAIVQCFADRGVELLRVPRGGKTMAENLAAERVRGDYVICTDASILIYPDAVKMLVRRFLAEPDLGVVSGRGIVVPVDVLARGTDAALESAGSDGRFYDYVHWLRTLESDLGATVGATGGLYALRRDVFMVPLPSQVTRDMACTMVAYERGLRSAQENRARCVVGAAASLRNEYRRKMRTMINGLDTLWYFRRLLDPFRARDYAWRLWGHKVSRWLVYPLMPVAALGLLQLAPTSRPAALLLAAGALGLGAGLAALQVPDARRGRALSLAGFAVAGMIAGLSAWWSFLRGRHAVVWEPTQRTRDDAAALVRADAPSESMASTA